nr:MAG TPA: hypothetical protein [Caudoviricetes sp.]
MFIEPRLSGLFLMLTKYFPQGVLHFVLHFPLKVYFLI